MKLTVKVEGLRETRAALRELPKATQKSVLRRVARLALAPFLAAVKAKAPVGDGSSEPPGQLRDSYVIGTKLTRRQRRAAKREGKSSIEMYAGTADPAGINQEFGNINHGPQPHARPAWDETKEETLDIVATGLWEQIDKAAERLARKAARLAAKNGG